MCKRTDRDGWAGKTALSSSKLDLSVRTKLVKVPHFEYSFVRCWIRTEKVRWINRVRNKGLLHRVKYERNVLQIIKIRKGNLIGLPSKTC